MAAGAKHQAALSTQKVQTVQTPLEEKHLTEEQGRCSRIFTSNNTGYFLMDICATKHSAYLTNASLAS